MHFWVLEACPRRIPDYADHSHYGIQLHLMFFTNGRRLIYIYYMFYAAITLKNEKGINFYAYERENLIMKVRPEYKEVQGPRIPSECEYDPV